MEINIPNSEKFIHVTVSIGVMRGEGELSALVKAADEAMLLAKNKGRNRTEYHS